MSGISLQKKIEGTPVDFQKKVQKAQFTLSQVGLDGHQAKMGLVLDRSISCQGFYRDGTMQEAAERLLALAVQLDDDGEIDVFGFHNKFWRAGSLNLSNFQGGIDKLFKNEWGGTEYGPAISGTAKHFFGKKRLGFGGKDRSMPAFVQFITDGECQDPAEAEKAMIDVSGDPIFFNFVGIGHARFTTLDGLDKMDGRKLDNADFFKAADLKGLKDSEAFQKMLVEYPGWVEQAKQAGIIG